MSAEWPRVKISEVCELIVDCVNKTAPCAQKETIYKMIRTPNVKNGRVDLSDCRYVEKEIFERWTKRAKVLKGDVLLTREAPLGEVGKVDFCDTVFLGQRLMQYRADGTKLDSDFLLYTFLSPDLQHQFRMHEGSGSVVSHIRVPDCSKFELSLPPLPMQKRIAKILSDLDNKINLNTRINQTLEQIAQAIFKSWFVDFDPVKAKMEALASGGTSEDAERAAMRVISGKDGAALKVFEKEHPEAYKELEATAALFPSTMRECELGVIPAGWEVCTIGESYNITMGQSPAGTTYNEKKEGTLFFQGRAEFGWRFPEPRLYTTAPKRMAGKGDVLMSVRAPVGDLNVALTECCIGRGLAALRSKIGNTTFSYYQLKYLQKTFETFNGEGTVFGSINQKDLKSIQAILPTEDVLMNFLDKVEPIDEMVESLSLQINQLTHLRDTLLPKLLSGEIDLEGIRPLNPPQGDLRKNNLAGGT